MNMINQNMKKSLKSVGNEAWISKDSNNMYGRKMLIFIDRFTGKEMVFTLVEERVEPRFVYSAENAIDPEEMYGSNGLHRATWQNTVIANQTEDQEN